MHVLISLGITMAVFIGMGAYGFYLINQMKKEKNNLKSPV